MNNSYNPHKSNQAGQPNTCCAIKKGDFYMVPGTYQPCLSPRFSNYSMPSLLRYRLPPNNYMASPQNHPFLYNYPHFSPK